MYEAGGLRDPEPKWLSGERVIRVQIFDAKHPHHEEYGTLTGRYKRFPWAANVEPMLEVALENCAHGTEGCFAAKSQLVLQNGRMWAKP